MRVDPLALAARQGRWVLVVGLAFGIGAPGLAAVLRPFVPEMVLFLLFLGALRMGPAAFAGARADTPRTITTVLALQLALPLCVVAVSLGLGVAGTPTATALAVMCTAPSIVGSPNMCLMLGAPPARAMRLLVTGTALLPLTVVPVFWLLPDLGSLSTVLGAAIRLLVLIGLATGAGFALRATLWRAPSITALARLDGVSALVLAVFVIGLMPSVGALLREDPATAAYWLALVFAVNFGLQALVFRLTGATPDAVPGALIAGNRNIALFLVALPPEVTAPILPFIGCYQLPMFLTPLLLARLYRNRSAVSQRRTG